MRRSPELLRGGVMEVVKTLLRQVLMLALVDGASRLAWWALIRAGRAGARDPARAGRPGGARRGRNYAGSGPGCRISMRFRVVQMTTGRMRVKAADGIDPAGMAMRQKTISQLGGVRLVDARASLIRSSYSLIRRSSRAMIFSSRCPRVGAAMPMRGRCAAPLP